jgi:hypothetical protein
VLRLFEKQGGAMGSDVFGVMAVVRGRWLAYPSPLPCGPEVVRTDVIRLGGFLAVARFPGATQPYGCANAECLWPIDGPEDQVPVIARCAGLTKSLSKVEFKQERGKAYIPLHESPMKTDSNLRWTNGPACV